MWFNYWTKFSLNSRQPSKALLKILPSTVEIGKKVTVNQSYYPIETLVDEVRGTSKE